MILCGGALTGASDPKVYKTNKNSNEINGGEKKKKKSKNLLNSLNNIEWTGYLILFFFFFSTNDFRFIKTPRIKYKTCRLLSSAQNKREGKKGDRGNIEWT
jgi:hypothetical protein